MMIHISRIDKDLSVFANRQVIIFGSSVGGRYMLQWLRYFDIEIESFCDNDKNKVGTRFCGYPVISVEELLNLYTNAKEKYLIQLASVYEKDIKQQLVEHGVEDADILPYFGTKFRLRNLRNYRNRDNQSYQLMLHEYEEMHRMNSYQELLRQMLFEVNNITVLCMPAKTGDHSLEKTFREYKFPYCQFWHRPILFRDYGQKLFYDKPIKIITAVREPIAQNISIMFQVIDDYISPFYDCEELWENGGDAQKLFDKWLELEGYMGEKQYSQKESYLVRCHERGDIQFMIQKFWLQFCYYVGDVMKQPFDKEKGYSVVRVKNYEVFIYQIEKLNSIKDALFAWCGIENAELLNDNIGDEKWYAEIYKRFKEEAVLSPEYIEKCYNEEYVKHFYSESDIEKFRSKWENR